MKATCVKPASPLAKDAFLPDQSGKLGTVPLSERQKQTFEKVGYGIGINPPRFNYRPKVDAREVLKKTDVGVDVNI